MRLDTGIKGNKRRELYTAINKALDEGKWYYNPDASARIPGMFVVTYRRVVAVPERMRRYYNSETYNQLVHVSVLKSGSVFVAINRWPWVAGGDAKVSLKHCMGVVEQPEKELDK